MADAPPAPRMAMGEDFTALPNAISPTTSDLKTDRCSWSKTDIATTAHRAASHTTNKTTYLVQTSHNNKILDNSPGVSGLG